MVRALSHLELVSIDGDIFLSIGEGSTKCIRDWLISLESHGDSQIIMVIYEPTIMVGYGSHLLRAVKSLGLIHYETPRSS